MCVVFAETEIIGLLVGDIEPCDIAAGVQVSVAKRIAALAGRRIEGPVIFTGGVATLAGMREALQSTLNQTIRIAPDPLYTGALGAALMANSSNVLTNR